MNNEKNVSFSEKSTIMCKVCKLIKTRILVGKFDDKNKKWVNEDGKLFNGKTCPDCHKDKVRNETKQRRNKVC